MYFHEQAIYTIGFFFAIVVIDCENSYWTITWCRNRFFCKWWHGYVARRHKL